MVTGAGFGGSLICSMGQGSGPFTGLIGLLRWPQQAQETFHVGSSVYYRRTYTIFENHSGVNHGQMLPKFVCTQRLHFKSQKVRNSLVIICT